ncbi:epiplakin-like [Pogoniulus pusillus]|uniref:epiplakin-like n=1 Tax=Pogoniulus pusillus TaxID=488313 RepID=UPI0030B96AFA
MNTAGAGTMQELSGSPQNNSVGTNLSAGGHKAMAEGNFIAGVFLQATKKKLSIYEAMVRGLLTPGTALVLLEAQAASGLLVDPVKNRQLSVAEALAEGLIGRDFHQKLLSAEGAVAGYTEPCTGRKMSLLQAMQRGLIVKEHGMRLLGAQIATGGIIDPVHGHRLPVEVACQRGYLGQELCQCLLDPKNQTRSCFDPNTQENLTYLQLLCRCVPDPATGLLMLQLMDKGSVLYRLTEDARKALQSTRTTLGRGLFQGQSVTLWELLFSRYVPEPQREELLRRYKAGTVTIPEMVSILTTTITPAEEQGSSTPGPAVEVGPSQPVPEMQSQEQQLRKSLKSATVSVTAGELRGQSISLLDLLFSSYVPQEKRQELLELYRAGILTTEQVATVVTAIVNRTEASSAALLGSAGRDHKVVPKAADREEEISAQEDILKSTTVDVPAGEFQGRQVSVWDLLFSDYISEEKRQELLQLYHERLLTLEQMTTVVTMLVKKKESTRRKFQVSAKTSSKDTVPPGEQDGEDSSKEEPWETALKTTVVDMGVGEFQGHKVSVWDLLHSKYIPEENRKELLELYQAGELTLEQVKTVVSGIVTKAEAARAEQSTSERGPREESMMVEAEGNHLQDRTWEETLKSTTVKTSTEEPQDKQISVWDLLFSRNISEEKRQELLQLYCAGTLPIQELVSIVVGSESLPQQTADLLQSEGSYITFGQFQEQKVSVWELLSSKQISKYQREAQLDTYGRGRLMVNKVTITTTVVTRPQRLEKSCH